MTTWRSSERPGSDQVRLLDVSGTTGGNLLAAPQIAPAAENGKLTALPGSASTTGAVPGQGSVAW